MENIEHRSIMERRAFMKGAGMGALAFTVGGRRGSFDTGAGTG